MSVEQVKQQMAIVNTLRFMTIQVQRMQASADIVGQGEQALELDTLRGQVDRIGLIADELLATLRNGLDTEEMPAVVIYDDEGNEVDSSERSA